MLRYRLRTGTAPLRCDACQSEITYAFRRGLLWPATGFAAGLSLVKWSGGHYLAAVFIVAFVAMVAGYYTTPFKSG